MTTGSSTVCRLPPSWAAGRSDFEGGGGSIANAGSPESLAASITIPVASNTAAGAELHFVGVYHPDDRCAVDVEVRRTDKPVVLALCSWCSVLWRVKVADGGRLKAVLVGGGGEQEMEGVPAGIPVVYRTYDPPRNADYFLAYKGNTFAYRRASKS